MSRVALLTPYAAPVPGGISTFVRGLAELLDLHGDEVFLFAAEGNGDHIRRSNLGFGRAFVARATRGLEELRPDVIHCHSHWYALAASVRYARRHPGTRLVFSFHTTSVPFLKVPFVRLLNQAHVTTFVSSAQQAHIRFTLRLAGDLRIFRPATNVPKADPDEMNQWASRLTLERAFPILVFVGPLEYEKKVAGVIDLVRAFVDVQARYPEARLLIVGDGSLRSSVQAAASALPDSVTITGFLGNPALAMARADIYCQVTRQEGLPIAMLEAMSMGRCVIGSRVGGIPEVLDGTNGVIVGLKPAEIARVICELLENRQRRNALGQCARRTIERFYTWESRIPLLASMYALER